MITGADPVRVTLEVTRVWKGSVAASTVIATARMEATCGFSFQQNVEYVIYARNGRDTFGSIWQNVDPVIQNGLATSLCSGTKPLLYAEADLAALGEGRAPDPITPSDLPRIASVPSDPTTSEHAPAAQPHPMWIVLLIGAAVLVASTTGLWIMRRGR